jgi:hypothetical protein
LGYLVSAAMGEVGDFRCAERSPLPRSLALVRATADCVFLCFRCLRSSSLLSLILIDLRVGPVSSAGCRDLDRACRLLERDPSDSDSDERPDDVEEDEVCLGFGDSLRYPVVLPYSFSETWLGSSMALLPPPSPNNLPSCEKGAKLPYSS